jgi:glutamate racemase
MSDPRPIGMFDSGVGGLTVARAVLDLLPHEPLIYFGDTGRAPYGPRDPGEIRRFALEIAEYLVSREVKMLVVACNAVESSGIEHVTDAAGIPVLGVIDPGVRAAIAATRNGRIGLIGTKATVESGSYDRAVARTARDVRLVPQACPAFVEFVERGDTSSSELLAHAREYLAPLRASGVDTLILGCTHYPLLSGLLQHVIGPDVVLISSAEETAKDVWGVLVEEELEREEGDTPRHEWRCSGDPLHFRMLAERFVGPGIGDVGRADLAVARVERVVP